MRIVADRGVTMIRRGGLHSCDAFRHSQTPSPEAFNRVTQVPVVLPITRGGSFARTAGFAVLLIGAGVKTTGVVRCDQPWALDLRARKGRKLERVPDTVVDEVLARLAPIFE